MGKKQVQNIPLFAQLSTQLLYSNTSGTAMIAVLNLSVTVCGLVIVTTITTTTPHIVIARFRTAVISVVGLLLLANGQLETVAKHTTIHLHWHRRSSWSSCLTRFHLTCLHFQQKDRVQDPDTVLGQPLAPLCSLQGLHRYPLIAP